MNGEDTNLALFAALTKVATEVAELRGSLTTGLENLRAELLGPGGRITKIEEEHKNSKLWQNVKTYCIIPINVVLQGIFQHFGWKI